MAGEPTSKNDEVDGYYQRFNLNSSEFNYQMDHPKRGKFIIINNKTFHPQTGMPERPGTDVDADSLYKIFKNFGFDVKLHHNVTRDAMLKLMIEAGRENHTDCDCIGVAVLSHGDDGVLYGTDSVIAIENFVDPIKRCKTLIGKPKIFLFQACRGTELDHGQQQQADAVGESARPAVKLPLEADMLYAYSTVPGYYAWRQSSTGSWFVQALRQVLSKPESRGMEFLHVLTRVSHAVAYQFESTSSDPEMNRMKQVPSIVSMLTKDLYLVSK